MRPTGEQFEITSGDYRAVATQVGGGLDCSVHPYIALEPGQRHEVTWHIAAVTG